MTIGAAWNIDDPTKPWMLWDPDANIKIPIGVADWMADLSTSYGSHSILAAAPLECADPGSHVSGTIAVRMKLVTSPTYKAGTKYPFTIRVTGADGITKDDRTLWLKVKDR
jgi:hypothetical protein